MENNKRIIKEYPVGSILGNEEIDAIRRVLESGDNLTRGKDVDLFEQEFAEYCGAKHAVAVSSCGAALHIATKVLNLGPEDEVICQVNAFWVTFVHLLERNLKIKVADINPQTLNIEPSTIEPLISSKTKAIYIVHMGGNPADLDPIRVIAKKHGIVVVEDSAHAAGSEYKGRKIGSDSDIACFSFSSYKNMSTLGEGGMFVTNNEKFADMASHLRTNYPYGEKVKRQVTDNLGNYPKPKSPAFMHAGDAWDYDWIRVDGFGSTYRLSTPQAAVGRVQLKKLDGFNEIRAKIATKYNEAINNIDGLRTLWILPNCKNSWHLFNFFIDNNLDIDRNKFVRILEYRYNILTFLRFWPIHLGGIMRMRGHHLGECPVFENIWFNKQLSLPITPQMEEWEINTIIEALGETLERMKKSR